MIRLAGKKDTYIFPDGKVWDYRENEVRDRDGKIYIEAVFMDVTKQYHEKINLTKQTEKLKEISRELRYLSDNVLILTREREVLAAKTKLHDQMGAGLTAIRQNLLQGSEDYSDAVRLLCQAVNAIWNDNQQSFGEGEFEQFLQDAKTLGVKIECLGSLPKNEDYANIYILAMRECLTNGVCHAGATELFITMQENNDFYRIRITNNGAAPEKEVVPKGGLYNLSRHIFDHGGEMQIQSIPYFALTITFQKKESKNEKVLIVEDQRMPRENMERILLDSGKYALSASVNGADVALAVCRREQIDLILMDVCTAGNKDGIEAATEIKAEFPGIKIIIVTSMVEVGYLKRAKEAKVDSFWYKDISPENLIDVIERTMAGESIFPDKTPSVKLGLADSSELTAKEIEVLRFVCEGLEYSEIAERMHISQRTVKFHISNILSKTGYANKTRLAIAVTNKNFIIPSSPEKYM